MAIKKNVDIEKKVSNTKAKFSEKPRSSLITGGEAGYSYCCIVFAHTIQ